MNLDKAIRPSVPYISQPQGYGSEAVRGMMQLYDDADMRSDRSRKELMVHKQEIEMAEFDAIAGLNVWDPNASLDMGTSVKEPLPNVSFELASRLVYGFCRDARITAIRNSEGCNWMEAHVRYKRLCKKQEPGWVPYMIDEVRSAAVRVQKDMRERVVQHVFEKMQLHV